MIPRAQAFMFTKALFLVFDGRNLNALVVPNISNRVLITKMLNPAAVDAYFVLFHVVLFKTCPIPSCV